MRKSAAFVRLQRRNAELEHQVAELVDRNRALRAFVADAAHELMEPLVMIEAMALAGTAPVAGAHRGDMATGADSISRLAARGRLVVETLLQDARFAERPPELETIDLAEVMEDALTLAQRSTRAADARIAIGPMPTLVSNAQLLTIVVRNLVANAAKHGSARAGDIEISADRDGGGWRLSVSSRGRAISPRETERIFRRFQHGDDEQRRGGGAGLGLAICARIVARLGGTLGVIPEPGIGNRFFVFLPDVMPTEPPRTPSR